MTRLAPLLVALLAVAVYGGAVRDGVVRDDYYIVAHNALVTGERSYYIVAHNALVTGERSPWLIPVSHYWAGTDAAGDLYRPLTVATYWLNARLAGMEPWSFHLVNVLLHGLAAALVTALGLRLTASPAAASVAGALFATHPVLSEAVVSIVGRADILAAIFVLGAWRLRDRRGISLVLFGLGLLSKESAIVLPGLLISEDLVRGRARTRLGEYAAHGGVIAVYLAARAAVLGGVHAGAITTAFVGVPFGTRLTTATSVLARYVGLLFYPRTLSADYSYAQITIETNPFAPLVLAGGAAALAAAAVALYAWRRAPVVSIGFLGFAAALFPVSNIPFGIGEIMAERLLYLPAVGFCLAAGAALDAALVARGVRRRGVAALAVVAIPVSLFAARAWVRVQDWETPLTFCEATRAASPRSHWAHANCGTVYQNLSRLADAEAEFRRAIEIDPGDAGTYVLLGNVHEAQGRLPEAIGANSEAARRNPRDADALNNLGRLLAATGRPVEAAAALSSALALRPDSAAIAYNLAIALLGAGRLDAAEAQARKILEAHPGLPSAEALLSTIRERRAGGNSAAPR
ncbi:MAG: tetratricopeptide repeat protein [Acidobacteria bacterium]|nr:tetratricopeptide repeat protein [Acidobacteriota bacterium]